MRPAGPLLSPALGELVAQAVRESGTYEGCAVPHAGLLELWREKHPEKHERTMIDFEPRDSPAMAQRC